MFATPIDVHDVITGDSVIDPNNGNSKGIVCEVVRADDTTAPTSITVEYADGDRADMYVPAGDMAGVMIYRTNHQDHPTMPDTSWIWYCYECGYSGWFTSDTFDRTRDRCAVCN